MSNKRSKNGNSPVFMIENPIGLTRKNLAVVVAVAISGCDGGSINPDDATKYAEKATYKYINRICNVKEISISAYNISEDSYVDSGKLYKVTQHVSINGSPPFDVVVQVPKLRYSDETNAAMVGGEVFYCKDK